MKKRRLGVLGRADRGGLAQQSLAVARHLDPVVALVIDMSNGGRGRGPFDAAPWLDALGDERVMVTPFPVGDDALDWLLSRCDVVYAAEGPPPGRDDFPQLCADRGVEFVIHANPELWRDRYRGPTTRIVLPTSWHAERFPDAPVLSMPVDRVRFPFKARTQARNFLHVAAPAFHDRNGSEIVRAMLPFIRTDIRIYVRGLSDTFHEEGVGNVRLTFLPPVDDHADLYPNDTDVLLLPRRYSGQSLTMLEAGSLGLPIVSLDVPPQNEWAGVLCVPPLPEPRTEWMIGGEEQVWDADPRDLARAVERLAGDPPLVEKLSRDADERAAALDWRKMLPVWRKALGV